MSDDTLEKTIREYIEQVVHLSLATSDGVQPWISELHFAYDKDLNLYFVSEKNRRHSEEIASNPRVAGNIVTQHHKHQKVRAVYFEGKAEQLTGVDENHVGYQEYVKRLGGWPTILKEIADNGKAALYKISVDNFYLFDGYEGNGKLQLRWNKL